MSGRSRYEAPNCSKARKAAKTIGRHARRLQRREKRLQAGDFTAQFRGPQYCADVEKPGHIDKTLKRLYRGVLQARRTRSCTW